MGRRATGRTIPTTSTRGRGWAIRFTAYGQRRYLTLGDEADGWTESKARDELDATLALVRVGRWQPDEPVAPPAPERDDPTFHDFATEWLASVESGLRPNTVLDYRWQLTHHLIPFFGRHRLSEITVREVDRYRDYKQREKDGLGAVSINKTLTRLGQVLERAVEYEVIDRNPVRVGKRKLKTSRVTRSYLDDAQQVVDLLAAAGELDAAARADRRHIPRRAIVATLALAGVRIGEALALRWRDVDLANSRLYIADSKTDAGVRHVTIRPALHDELAAWKSRSRDTRPGSPVFASRNGKPLGDDNVRNRVFAPSVKRANENRAELELPPLPENLTPHSLRRTFISAVLVLTSDVRAVMAEVGHTDPAVTFGIYAQVMRRDDDARKRLRALLDGGTGTEAELNYTVEGLAPAAQA